MAILVKPIQRPNPLDKEMVHSGEMMRVRP